MFKELHELCQSEDLDFGDREIIEMAIWFHDTIYDTQRKDNEVKSAEFFRTSATRVGMKKFFIDQVLNLILATKHTEVPENPTARILCDLDLSILGQSESVFDKYEGQIRQEYDWVPEQEFIKGRVAVLQSLLDRPHIYSTEFFREKYEEQARRNLTRSISQLSAGRLQS